MTSKISFVSCRRRSFRELGVIRFDIHNPRRVISAAASPQAEQSKKVSGLPCTDVIKNVLATQINEDMCFTQD